jgi:DNA-binding response OmpR family regulator
MVDAAPSSGPSLDTHRLPSNGYDLNLECTSFWDQTQFRVLVVGTDKALVEALSCYLEKHEFRVRRAFSIPEISKLLADGSPQLVVLDQSGWHSDLTCLQYIRSRCEAPILIAGGSVTDEVTISVAFELGADGWLVRPFGYRELLARARAVLRRFPHAGPPWRLAHQRWAHFGGWCLYPAFRRLLNPDGIQVPLANAEFTMLMTFVEAPQRRLTRDYLLRATRMHSDALHRSIDVQVLRLRRKIEVNRHAPAIIQTCQGVGYRFALPVEWTDNAVPGKTRQLDHWSRSRMVEDTSQRRGLQPEDAARTPETLLNSGRCH